MRRNAELGLNMIALVVAGILIAIQLLTDTNPVLLAGFVVLFIVQTVALIVRIKERET